MLPVAVLAGVPVTPDRDTARQWLVQELSKPEYATQPSLLERLWLWFVHLFDAIPGVSAPPWQVLLGVLVVAAVVVVVARTVAGPVRLARARAARPVSAADDARTAAQLRSAADAAADRRDWPLAVAERFRAVVRGLEERVVIDESPGRTAQEAATAAGTRLPVVFNTSGYESTATLEAYADMMDVALCDLRYASGTTAREASQAGDYVRVARAALRWFWERLGPLQEDENGIATRGTIVRVLILPGHADEAVASLRWLAENLGTGVHVSLMAQYTPAHNALALPPWDRPINEDEYNAAAAALEDLGFENG
ncbi:MAG: hypothetical protein FWF90_02850, partial [Promicromonosporaceae bacterium]|nr:hypothetical protein [Promicromonosporaceae bacterium]